MTGALPVVAAAEDTARAMQHRAPVPAVVAAGITEKPLRDEIPENLITIC
jgi:hypothetical protein